MAESYYRPIVQKDACKAPGAVSLAGGWTWFSHAEHLGRGHVSDIVAAKDMPKAQLDLLTRPRAAVCALSMEQPRIMGILNATPDSFSDGGLFQSTDRALEQCRRMVSHGVDVIDIGGESTRPGAEFVPPDVETGRVIPIIEAMAQEFPRLALSIDTRKAGVAQAALKAGAGLFNDVSALSYDPDSLSVAAKNQSFVCLMHASGDPKTMQADPVYEDVLLDVYDYLAERVQACVSAGIDRDKIIVDPGIGFGKTLEHNLTLIKGISLFHGLGCPVLLGASRKRFIGTVAAEPDATARMPGSIAVALEGLRQGVQICRVHDTKETKQAITLWQEIS